MLIFDTICALATPPYKSALAIVRLSGPNALNVLSHMIKKDVKTLLPNTTFYTKIYKDKKDSSSLIDEAVVSYFKGPKSYTGFDSVEFSIHGNPLIANELMDALVKHGARRAERGEFSAQAYYNGKLDLLKAEGINDLINATSKKAKKIAMSTLSGRNSTMMTALKSSLLDDLSQLEYYVENAYEDRDDYTKELDEIETALHKEIHSLEVTIEKTKKANKEYIGYTVAIVGEPNVGKSTLLNHIVGEDKAIVSSIPGTTRDIVEGNRELNGILFTFKDTAGIRRTTDEIENLGIERAYQTIEEADLVLLASDNGFEEIQDNHELEEALKNKQVIKIATKDDINTKLDGADIAYSTKENNLAPLFDLILSKLDLTKKEESLFLGKREEDYLIKIKEQLEITCQANEDTHQIDIVSDNLRVAIAYINELMGNNEGKTMEDIYDTLFSKFCLGK